MFVFDRRIAPLFGLLAACAQQPDIPDPPDVSRLLATYEDPPGTVEPSHPTVLLGDSVRQLAMLGGGQANLVFLDVVSAATTSVDQTSLPTNRDSLIPTRL